jgi:hypothetical protein
VLRALVLLAAVLAVTSLPCLVALAINAEDVVERAMRAVRRGLRRRRALLRAALRHAAVLDAEGARRDRSRVADAGNGRRGRGLPHWWPFGRARRAAPGRAAEPAAGRAPARSQPGGDAAEAGVSHVEVDWDEMERSATAAGERAGARASLTRRRRLVQLAWALRHSPEGLPEPAGPPIEQIAADLRRLGQQRLGIATRSPVWFSAVSRAYDDRLRAACRALRIDEHLGELTGVDLEIERVRVEGVLKAAGMRFGDTAERRSDP